MCKNVEQEYIDTTPRVKILSTLRSSGYNNYTAIADIVDNSLDSNVGSKKVNIIITEDSEKKSYESIMICDDGCGMDKSTLKEALKLGAETGKKLKDDLGAYGTGLKAAGIAIGTKFIVQTKSENGKFWIVEYDLENIIDFKVPINEGTIKEYREFKKLTKSKTGTIVTLLNFDRVSNHDLQQFKTKLNKDFGIFYKNFIESKKVKIYINNKLVVPIDPMYRKEPFSKMLSDKNEMFKFGGKDFVFNTYLLNKIDKTDNKKLILPRNYRNNGLYIYRNGRLVGAGLDLGILNMTGDGHLNGLRIELFVDGEADELFASTFMKMIHEKDKDEINQIFKNKARRAFQPYIKMVREAEEARYAGTDVSEDIVNQFKAFTNNMNGNPLMEEFQVMEERAKGVETRGTKKSGIDAKKDPSKATGRKNAFSPRKKRGGFSDWEFINLGERGNLFNVSKEKGKYVVHMNKDHVFWKEFLSKSNNNTQSIISMFFVAMAVSLDSIGYYDETEKELLLQEYLLETSINLRKLIVGG
tara:strand:- start:32942 stop:34522 length:1581 start_codon:yes stop_codon:yes gene_type:complete